MEAWRILGIARGSDVAAIKRAYALKIKQHRPDSDPVEFQRIHQAYKTLLASVRRQQTSPNRERTPAVQAFSSGLIFSQQGVQASAARVAPVAEPSAPSLQESQQQEPPLQEPPLLDTAAKQPEAEPSATTLQESQLQEPPLQQSPLLDTAAKEPEAEPSVTTLQESQLQEPPLQQSPLLDTAAKQPEAEPSTTTLQEPPQQEADAAQQETERRRQAARQAQAQLAQERILQQQARQQAFEAMLLQVTENFQNQQTLVRLEPWQFLTTSPWLLDGEFNDQLSIRVFKLLAAHYHELNTHKRRASRARKRYGPVQPSYGVLALFDQLFNWQGQQTWLGRFADEQVTRVIFNRLHDGPDVDPVKGLRGRATVLKVEQDAEPAKVSFNWENLVGWLVALSLVVQMLKAAFFH